MIDCIRPAGQFALLLLLTGSLCGCGTAYKEKTAPCKRPANLTSYASDPRHDCGPMASVNDPAAAFAAIEGIANQGQ